jgi:cyclic beta-1,2-glucan synthetase
VATQLHFVSACREGASCYEAFLDGLSWQYWVALSEAGCLGDEPTNRSASAEMEKLPVAFDLQEFRRPLQSFNRWKSSRKVTPATSVDCEEPQIPQALYSVEQLDRHARSLAGSDSVKSKVSRFSFDPLLGCLSKNQAVLAKAYKLVTQAVTHGRRITPAAEWFLDNYPLIEEQIRTARRDLPSGYSRELPRLNSGEWTGYPRVYIIAQELIAHVDGRVDAQSLLAFVAAYQSEKQLTLGELWAIPIMLRLALLENLRLVVERVAAGRKEREMAVEWTDRMMKVAAEPAKVLLVLADMVKVNPVLTNAFVTEYATRMHAAGTALSFPVAWLDNRMTARGQTVEQIFQQASQIQAADQVSIGNSIGSLRFLCATEWRDFVETASGVEHILRTDPSGVYPLMDFQTRDQYRHVVEAIAKLGIRSESEVAAQLVKLSRQSDASGSEADHIGYFLFGDGQDQVRQWAHASSLINRSLRKVCGRFSLAIYLGSIGFTTTLLSAIAVYTTVGIRQWQLHSVIWCLLVFACMTQLATTLVNWVTMLTIKPHVLPRMDYSKGLPEAQRSIVAIPAMLSSNEEIDELVADLEVRFLANRISNLNFALLTDFRDAAGEQMPEDEGLLEHVRHAIEALNVKYSGRASRDAAQLGGGTSDDDEPAQVRYFFLFHRTRRWNVKDKIWMGWERKRGKLEDFNAALRGETGRFDLIIGPLERLAGTRYVVTLDSDTQLPRDSAWQLVGTMAHPLNKPFYDPKLRRVTKGYGILQPRVGISMRSANRSRFAGLFAGEAGIDPYTQAVSDVYQDVFKEGSFIGKGIYDVDTCRQAIKGRLPDNRVLSHDLLEGAFARSGLISDVLLFEDYPSCYLGESSRRSRWIRGDWQTLLWLLPRVPTGDGSKWARNSLSALSRWKILDNLRRSLMPGLLLTLLIFGWFIPGSSLACTTVVLLILVLPAFLNAMMELSRRSSGLPRSTHARLVALSMNRQILQEGYCLTCLPYDAFVSLHAVVRTLWRMGVTGRGLLQWRMASDAKRAAKGACSDFVRSMWIMPTVSVALVVSLILFHPASLIVAGPILAAWFVSPILAFALSRLITGAVPTLSTSDLAFLGTIARRTWRFFEVFASAEDNYLPPDNFQEQPPGGIAHRTSPTNIGLALLSNLAAYDFGYIPVSGVIERTTQTLDTLNKLERYRGHFYNWYDTQTLKPLIPAYVSTVDSGNLAGHLLTLAAGLDELSSGKIFCPVVFTGLDSVLQLLIDAASESSSLSLNNQTSGLKRLQASVRTPPRTLSNSRNLLRQISSGIEVATATSKLEVDAEWHWWVAATQRQCAAFAEELDQLAPWLGPVQPADIMQFSYIRDALAQIGDVPTLADVAGMEAVIVKAIDTSLGSSESNGVLQQFRAKVVAASELAAKRVGELRQLAVRCRELAEIEYGFLYNKDRRLLSIGYNVTDHRLDAGCYDLLASEARLASYLAIAQEKLPSEHWFSLGRSVTSVGGGMALISWSGSMFEYLMPLLVMPTYQHTLLDETYRSVVKRQISYGRERMVAWGISESGYNKTDLQGNYQYQSFGIPGLGFKRGLAHDLVISPYAGAMGLMVDAPSACANLERLERDGCLSAFGFYEAVDYTPERLPPGQHSVIIRSYMAHHQGMAFASLDYLLHDRPMQRRFQSDPAFRSADLLLQERVPKSALVFPHPAEASNLRSASSEVPRNFRVFTSASTTVPEVHLLSNGRYHVAVTAAGGGYSRLHEQAITRWREDGTRDCWGSFCYLRDKESGEYWSASQQPTSHVPDTYEVIYSQGRAEYRRTDGKLESQMEISVSPEDDIELRRITLINRGNKPRTIELTSYAEVVLAKPAADAAAPAFSNLFVQTQLVRPRQAILCTRRPRDRDEKPLWMLHVMTVHGKALGETSYETSREQFIGRGRTTANPLAMERDALTDSEGAVLDPIVSIRNTVVIGPDETVRINIVTGAAQTEETALALIDKYHDPRIASRVFELAWTQSQVILRQLDATEADTQLFGRLASSVIFVNPLMRIPASVITRNRLGQSALWAYGISGDLPIVLVRIADTAHIKLVGQLVQAHTYWRAHGLAVDLIIWNEDQSGYRQNLHEQIVELINSRGERNLIGKPSGVFILTVEQISPEDRILMQTVARVIVSDSAGTLAEQMDRHSKAELPETELVVARAKRGERPQSIGPTQPALAAFNGIGGFSTDGREYVITTIPQSPTPAPWSNILANPWFGSVVSESGSAYTWCENAHSFRLSPWNDDPISDISGEAFYLRDEETGRYWSPAPFPVRGPMAYKTRHGFGYSLFEYAEDGISSQTQMFVATDAPIKFISIKLRNGSGRRRRLSITALFELVLGELRENNAAHIVTEVDPKTGALIARNAYNTDFAQRFVFLDCSEIRRTVTGDRREFLGRNGSPAHPASLSRARLSGHVGAGLDPCAAMQVMVDLSDGKELEIVFTFGTGRDLPDTRNLVNRFRGIEPAHAALAAVNAFWTRTLGVMQVETPDQSLNFLANGWLLYQVLACRVWGRSGFYQSGGAFGFRDQLQDVMALVHAQPSVLREQILRCASRQFKEGDVQHWWHPPQGRGVRTRISDDYLWLPFATCRYLAALGDTGVLDEQVAYLDQRLLRDAEESNYDLPMRSTESGTVYEHCLRAIKHGLRFGEHGLPLMGSGDWNDGMNLVGDKGKGESVWLAFFLYDVLMQFAALAKQRDDSTVVTLCQTQAATLRTNIEAHGWDGNWYLRAYFDDGRTLGSASNPECKIDSLPQSWSVLSGAGDPDRSRKGMDAVDRQLVKRDMSIIELFDPPFDKSDLSPGYVKGYVPGVRENGGQYTHAAIWTIMAFAAAGNTERAWELFRMIDPIHHGDTPEAIKRYKVEPYVIAADVYANPQHVGRGGWTWYTGSAGWTYRLITESLLGIHLEVDSLRFAPKIPKDWKSFKLQYRYRETVYGIAFQNQGGGKTVKSLTCDGQNIVSKTLRLDDDRKVHNVEVVLE